MKILYSAALCGVLLAGAAQARPVVVELFTSQACSSCPPADALLRELKASDPHILPLSFHVTYWNGTGWTDPYSLAAATARQHWYVGLAGGDSVYTPEAVIDGKAQLVGSARGEVVAAIDRAKAADAAGVPVSITPGKTVTVTVGPGQAATAHVLLLGFDSLRTTRIGGGENGGASLTEVNVVRSMTMLGPWNGTAQTYSVPSPLGEHFAVLVQRNDGSIEGAASEAGDTGR
jgi:hypothetical protein